MDDSVRILIWGAYILFNLFLLSYIIYHFIYSKPSEVQVAFALEKQIPDSYQTISASVQFNEVLNSKEPPNSVISKSLIEKVFQVTEQRIRKVSTFKLLSFQFLGRLWIFVLILLFAQIVFCCIPVLEYPNLLKRFFNPFGNYDRVSGITFQVQPGDMEGESNTTIKVKVHVSDHALINLGLYRGGEKAYRRYEMKRLKPGTFHFTLSNLKKDISYYIGEDNHQTRKYFIKIDRRPKIKNFMFKCEYPQYTQLAPQTQQKTSGNFEGLAGSQINLELEFDIAIARVIFRKISENNKKWQTHKDLEMKTKGNKAALNMELSRNVRYKILVFTNQQNQPSESLLTYTLKVIPDLPPTIHILKPDSVIKRGIVDSVNIQFKIKDDFFVPNAKLVITGIKREGQFKSEERKLNLSKIGSNEYKGETNLLLSELEVKVGEEIRYWIESTDLTGQIGKSSLHVIQIPIAPGEIRIRLLADHLKDVHEQLSGLNHQTRITCGYYNGMLKLLEGRPPKWTSRMNIAYTPLRDCIEKLIQQISHTLGIALEKEKILNQNSSLVELSPLVFYLKKWENQVKNLDTHKILINIRQDFKNSGTASAQEVIRVLNALLEPMAELKKVLEENIISLLLWDFTTRSRQLLKGEQMILIQRGEKYNQLDLSNKAVASLAADTEKQTQKNKWNSLLITKQIMLFNELDQMRGSLKALVKKSGLRTHLTLKKHLLQLRVTGNEFRKKVKNNQPFPVKLAQDFLPDLKSFYVILNKIHKEHFKVFSLLRERLKRSLKSAHQVYPELNKLSHWLMNIREQINVLPIDKYEELEVLPYFIHDLRNFSKAMDDLSKKIWSRLHHEDYHGEDAIKLNGLIFCALYLEKLKDNYLIKLKKHCENIAGTFPQKNISAIAFLKEARNYLGGLNNELKNLSQKTFEIEKQGLKEFPAQYSKFIVREKKQLLNKIILKNREIFQTLEHIVPGDPIKRNEVRRKDSKQIRSISLQYRHNLLKFYYLMTAFSLEAVIEYDESLNKGSLKNVNDQEKVIFALTISLRLEQVKQEVFEPILTALEKYEFLAKVDHKRNLLKWVKKHLHRGIQTLQDLKKILSISAAKRKKLLLIELAACFSNKKFHSNQELDSRKMVQLFLHDLESHFTNANSLLLFSQNMKQNARLFIDELDRKKDQPDGQVSSELNKIYKTVPSLRMGNREVTNLLEKAIQILSVISTRQKQDFIKLEGLQKLKQRIWSSYQSLAEKLPAGILQLEQVLKRTLEPARSLGTSVGQSIQEIHSAVKSALKYSHQFSKQSTLKSGQRLSQILADSGAKIGNTGEHLEGILDELSRKEIQRKSILNLWPKSEKIFQRLFLYASDYENHMERLAVAYDEMRYSALKACRLLNANSKTFKKYWNEVNAFKGINKKDWNGPGIRIYGKELEKYWNVRIFSPPSWTGKFIGGGKSYIHKYRYKYHPDHIKGKELDYNTYFLKDVVQNGTKNTSRFSLNDIIQFMEQSLDSIKKKNPGDIPGLLKFKKSSLEAKNILMDAIQKTQNLKWCSISNYTKLRRRAAKNIHKIEEDFKTIEKEILKLAKNNGWKPPKLALKRSPFLNSNIPASLSSAATLTAYFTHELNKIRVYTFLGGEPDPNFNLKITGKTLKTIPPPNAFVNIIKIASHLSKVLVELSHFAGKDKQLAKYSKNKPRSSLEKQLVDAIEHQYRMHGDIELIKYFNQWEKFNHTIMKIKDQYEKEWELTKNYKGQNVGFHILKKRHQYASKIKRNLINFEPVLFALQARALVEGWKKPKLNILDVDQRRVKIPESLNSFTSAANLSLGLFKELKGIYQYDLLAGEGDPKFDILIPRAKQFNLPPKEIFKFS